jgi:hypothetical protein
LQRSKTTEIEINTTQVNTINTLEFTRPNNSGGVFSEVSPLTELTNAIVQPKKIKIIGIISLFVGDSKSTILVTNKLMTIDNVANIPTTEVGRKASATKSRIDALALRIMAIKNNGRKQTVEVSGIFLFCLQWRGSLKLV